MINELRNLLKENYKNEDIDFYEGVIDLVGGNEEHTADIIDFIKTESPTTSELLGYCVYLHRGY